MVHVALSITRLRQRLPSTGTNTIDAVISSSSPARAATRAACCILVPTNSASPNSPARITQANSARPISGRLDLLFLRRVAIGLLAELAGHPHFQPKVLRNGQRDR